RRGLAPDFSDEAFVEVVVRLRDRPVERRVLIEPGDHDLRQTRRQTLYDWDDDVKHLLAEQGEVAAEGDELRVEQAGNVRNRNRIVLQRILHNRAAHGIPALG